jgi:hypothetical protein
MWAVVRLRTNMDRKVLRRPGDRRGIRRNRQTGTPDYRRDERPLEHIAPCAEGIVYLSVMDRYVTFMGEIGRDDALKVLESSNGFSN